MPDGHGFSKMKLLSLCSVVLCTVDLAAGLTATPAIQSGIKKRGVVRPKVARRQSASKCSSIVTPKFFIISMVGIHRLTKGGKSDNLLVLV